MTNLVLLLLPHQVWIQVYREKQVKDNTKEAPPSEETAPIVTSPSTTSKPPQESQVSSDGQKSEVGANESKQDPTLAAEITDETAVATNTSHETTQDERATSTERESSSSSDVPEDALGLVDEPSESHHGSRANVFDSEEMLSPIESPPELEPLQAPTVEKKHAAKEPRREKSKKDKGDKKKMARSKKDKRGSSLLSKVADALNEPATETQDKMLEALVAHTTPLSVRISQGLRKGSSAAASAGLAAFLGARRGCIWAAGRLNIKGILTTIFSYVESVLAVVFSVVLLLSLHAASWFIRIHRVAFRAILTHRHIGFCFAFLYGFPFLVQYVFPWAPPWAPVCLWYAFLVQLFCTNGPTAMVTTFRVILPLVFLVEGISHHSFLLDLNGAELLLTSFIISALKTSNLCSPIFFLSLATQCLLAVFLGSELVVQWLQLALALYSLHVMATTDDEWLGIGDEEDELACHPVSMHHSIADYNHHPAPSSAVSIQKTKRLDRRALAYVRGRKLR
uniref:TRP C-terminal domain-containing protein n=1 Tax=Phytophthora ramorum TaxID=164328 RepID=H3GEN9_PHYRM